MGWAGSDPEFYVNSISGRVGVVGRVGSDKKTLDSHPTLTDRYKASRGLSATEELLVFTTEPYSWRIMWSK